MSKTRRWLLDIIIDEDDHRIRARTLLRDRDGATLVGVGEAPHGPEGADDTLAVARALADLTHQLFETTHPDTAVADHRPAPRRRLAELAGYLGGGLMLGGAALLTATSWAELSRRGQIALLATTTVVLAIAGLLVAGRPLPRSRPPEEPTTGVRFRLSGVLLALAAGTTALTAGTIADTHEAFWAGTAGLTVALLGYLAVRSLPGVLASAVLSTMTVGTLVAEVLDANAVVLGISLVLLGLTWAALTATNVLTQRLSGFTAAAAIALIGAQQPLGESEHAGWAYGLTFGVAVVWLAGFLWQRSPVLLVAGILGITIAVPEAIWDWTDGAVGGAVLAVTAGAVLVAASLIGLRLGKHRKAT